MDAVLESGLRSAIAAYGESLRDTRRTAVALAGERSLQRALARRNRKQIASTLAGMPNIGVEGPRGLKVGHPPTRGVSEVVSIVGPNGTLGR